MGLSSVWVCSSLFEIQLWENPFLQNWYFKDLPHCSLVYDYIAYKCIQYNWMVFLWYMYTHVQYNFHFNKIFSHTLYLWMASLQNVYIHVHSSFHFKKYFLTKYALEWHFFRMCALILNQLSISRKSSLTTFTFERLLFRIHAYTHLQSNCH